MHGQDADAREASAAGRPRVLFADPDLDLRNRAKRLLGAGYEVEAVADGLAALDAAQRNGPDIVLANLTMPRLDGLGLLAALRADPTLSDVPVLLMSAHPEHALGGRRTQAGADDCLARPLDAPDFPARIDFHLRVARIRRESTQAVRRSDDRFARFMENLPGLAWIKDEEGRYLYANRAAQAAFGKEEAELYGKTDAEIFPPATAEQFRANDRAALTSENGTQTIETLEHPDGTLHHSVVAKFPIPASNGASMRVGGIAIDITERRRVELALRESERRFQLMADSAPVLIWMSGTDKLCTWFNKPWLDFVGRPMERELGDGWAENVHPDDYDGCLETYVTAFDERRPFSMEYRLRRHDGEYRWVFDNGIPIYGSHAEFAGYIGSCIDITDRKRAENALRESEERFRLVAESAPVMLWMGDADGKCVYINKALRDFWGVSLESLPAFDWSFTLHPDDRGALFAPFDRAMRTHTAFAVEARYKRADGVYRVLNTQARPRFGPAGEFVGMIGVNVDVTDTRRAEEQRTLLINELNHRVKNTLVTVQSLAMQTLRNTESCDDARRRLDARLTALSRAHDVLTRQSWQGAGLREVVDRALAPFRTMGERFRIEGPDARLSPKQTLALSMALHELATNAAKYGALSNDEGRVLVSWTLAAGDGLGRLELTWAESGGPPVAAPTRSGFGSRLIERSLAHDLGAAASIDYRPEGVVSVIKTPLERLPETFPHPSER